MAEGTDSCIKPKFAQAWAQRSMVLARQRAINAVKRGLRKLVDCAHITCPHRETTSQRLTPTSPTIEPNSSQKKPRRSLNAGGLRASLKAQHPLARAVHYLQQITISKKNGDVIRGSPRLYATTKQLRALTRDLSALR